MTAPAGTEVGLYVDCVDGIAVGDVIETETGRRYGVLKSRRQTRGKHVGRQHLRVVVLDVGAPLAPEARVHVIRWYRRQPRSIKVR